MPDTPDTSEDYGDYLPRIVSDSEYAPTMGGEGVTYKKVPLTEKEQL